MLGEWLTGKAPFSIVFLSGLIRDPEGKKMSKTTGNVVDPLGVIDDMGADALRFALINGSAPAPTCGSRRAAWRARATSPTSSGTPPGSCWVPRPDSLPDAPLELPVRSRMGPAEHWILSRCAETTAQVEEAYASFQFGEAARLLHQAIWSEYCDWYLELAKVQLAADQPAEIRNATWEVLAWVLDDYLRLLHPLMPFVTETLWSRLPSRPQDRALLMVSPWPDAADARAIASEQDAAGVASLIELIGAIRTARADAGIEPGTRLAARIYLADEPARTAYAALSGAVARLARVEPTLVATRGCARRGDADRTRHRHWPC